MIPALILFAGTMLLSLWAAGRVKSVYAKYSEVPAASGETGAEVAAQILDRAGIRNVDIVAHDEMLGDHYDPIHKRLVLSSQNYHGTSCAALGVAAHECGHAIQDKIAFGPLRWRMMAVGVTTYANQIVLWLPLIGMFTGFIKPYTGALLMAMAWGVIMLFNLITLPVEFDASRRAKEILAGMGHVATPDQMGAVKKVLDAAAWTYVAAFITSLAYLIWHLLPLLMGRREEQRAGRTPENLAGAATVAARGRQGSVAPTDSKANISRSRRLRWGTSAGGTTFILMITMDVALWGGFSLFIIAMLALDLGVFHRKAHVVTTKEALGWFGVWTALAMIFNLGILLFHERGGEAGLEFFTGYLVEKALSVDNIFVFILIFGYFQVPQAYQHKVLFWGIIGAIVLRVIFIVGGLALLERFHWMIYLFGAFLLFTGIQMMRKKDDKPDPDKNWIVQTFRRFFPVAPRFDGNRFFTRIDGRLVATPLFIVLLAVESSDIIFAVDSIPAIFAVTQEPFLVFTSNVFAMLGLRALYFAVSGFMQKFHLLHYGFASILVILGAKMLLSEVYKVPVAFSLVLVMVILLLCVILSLLRPRRDDLKMMFERPEKLGLMPFRRLLLIENVVDLGDLTVRDAMRHRSGVRTLRLDVAWDENLRLMRDTNFSRYPLIENANAAPRGLVHVKDLFFYQAGDPAGSAPLRELARPFATLHEDVPLDEALARFQRTRHHFAVVRNAAGDWTGILTLEDVLEELVGKIGDEFDVTRSGEIVPLAETLTPGRVVFGVEGPSLAKALAHLLSRVPKDELPTEGPAILFAALQRESLMTTYLGRGLAVPHCRLDSLEKPILIFGRSESGIPLEHTNERAELIFLLLTPSRMARIQPRLLADITGLIESEYVTQRLKNAERPEEIIEAIRDGQQIVLN